MSIIEFIRDRARFYNCPVCGRSLKGCDIQVLSHEHERFHLQVTCVQCQVTFIVVLAWLIWVTKHGVAGVWLIRRLVTGV